MSDINHIVDILSKETVNCQHQELCGKDKLVYELVENLCIAEWCVMDFILICTKEGLILKFYVDGRDEDLIGYTIDLGILQKLKENPAFFAVSDEYIIVTNFMDDIEIRISKLQSLIHDTLKIFEANKESSAQLLSNLDFIQNSISFFDKEMHLLYANQSWYDEFNIAKKEEPIGMTFMQIAEKYGMHFYNFEKSSYELKMYEVVRTGNAAVNWEIRLTMDNPKILPKLISNDMYPIKDNDGNVTGLIEITHSRQDDVRRIRKIVGLSAIYTFDDIVSASLLLQEKIHLAKEYSDTSHSVLITGESGVGKELFSQSVHNYSARRNGPFVAVNCANFPENLIESELFGYVEGAFTGASKKGNVGKFELADQGTLFLDEIGELPYHFQSKLLRVLETGEVTRIGSTQPVSVDVRVVAATNRDLEAMVRDGLFRGDLYFRLQVLNINIPPLRERKADLIPLAEALLKQIKSPSKIKEKHLGLEAEQVLLAYDWPGNARELRNVLSRADILSKTEEISAETLRRCVSPNDRNKMEVPVGTWMTVGGGELKKEFDKECMKMIGDVLTAETEKSDEEVAKKIEETQRIFEMAQIKAVLHFTEGNKKRAAELLGISRSKFYRLLEKLEVSTI